MIKRINLFLSFLLIFVYYINAENKNKDDYGYIEIEYPINEYHFTNQDLQRYKWGSPDNAIEGQSRYYKFKIVPTNGLTPTEAIVSNTPFYEVTTDSTTYNSGGQVNSAPFLSKGTEYAWQVTAYDESDNEFVSSDIFLCYGSHLVDMFWAGHHKIYVTSGNTDYNNYTGTGRLKITTTDTIDISFTNLKLKNTAGQWVLDQGEILHQLLELDTVLLTPRVTINNNCNLIIDSIAIKRNPSTLSYELIKKGFVEIKLTPNTIIKSLENWWTFDSYTSYGVSSFNTDNIIEMDEPNDFNLKISESATLSIYDNNYSIEADGIVILPENIKNTLGRRVEVPFYNIDNFYYFSTNYSLNNNIRLNNNTVFDIEPFETIFDFSNDLSPLRLLDDNSWKGVYFKRFNLIFNQDVDENVDNSLGKKNIYYYNIENNTDIEAWSTDEGLNILN